MRRLFYLMISLAVLVSSAAYAKKQDQRWIEVTGHAAVYSAADSDSARRRALADALFNAALTGGADVRGHSAVSQAVVTSDLTIVRAMGRVFDHRIVGQNSSGGMISVTIHALVGVGNDPYCPSPHRLVVSAYAPVLRVSPGAPAWAEPLAAEIASELVAELDRHPATSIVRITNRALPTGNRNEAFDYVALTTGSVRLGEGEMGFVPVLRISDTTGLGGNGLSLEAELNLHEVDGTVHRQIFRREVSSLKPALLGRAGELTKRDRKGMAKALTKDLKSTFAELLSNLSCQPLVAKIRLRDGKAVVPLGTRNGLSRAAVAFSVDRGTTSQLFEIVSIGASETVLRPLDPMIKSSDVSGWRVRFMEAGW